MKTSTQIALKDWAVAIEALGLGKQILLMRKGGIREETRHFELQSDEFFLYPAYEHQKEELLKPEFQGEVAKTLKNWSKDDQTTTIKYYAKLYEDIEVMDENALRRLAPTHIWTDNFATERLKWKKTLPLHLLLVRVYRLDQPVEVEIRPEYNSCKSWHMFPENLQSLSAEPVLTDEEFMTQVNKVKELLAKVTP
ncbi:DUF1802 family protein [Hazenella coriacea]|uniref:DUF1802 family protein n=1 Tax=Hazenella coriacea TaxID=1179467 RepID=A0A4V2UVX6_9BACL|nr:DUF1802 family protein [Hazenella coriacea]TCS97037.1 hypothetical protein EDD58_101685 [Hazenella coriacea]